MDKKRAENKAFEIITKAERKIEKLFWKTGADSIGNLAGDISEIKSKYRKITFSKN